MEYEINLEKGTQGSRRLGGKRGIPTVRGAKKEKCLTQAEKEGERNLRSDP